MVFGIVLTLIVTNVLTGFMTALIIRSGRFDKKTKLVGINKGIDAKIQFASNKIDFVKHAK